MSAPSVAGTATGVRVGPGTITVTPPAGVAWLAFVTGVTSGSTVTAPSGWTQVDLQIPERFYVFRSNAAPASSWTIGNGAGDPAGVVVVGYDRALSNVTLTKAVSSISPAVTATEAALAVRAVFDWNDADGDTTYPAAATLGRVQVHPGGSGFATIAVAHETVASGAVAAAAWTIPAVYAPVAYTILLTSPSTGTTGTTAQNTPALAQIAAGTRTVPAGTVASTPAALSQSAVGAVVNPPTTHRYPRTIDASGRFFRDQHGAPVLIKGDSPWSAFTDLSLAEWETWCANRQMHGFNAGYVSAIGATDNGAPFDTGATFDGILPFTGGNITVPNEPYWARVDAFFDIAAAHGITIFLYLMDGWNSPESVGGKVFSGASVADCYTYGRFIGTRYGGRENVIWMVGGDYEPVTNEPWDGSNVDRRFDAALRGARDTETLWHARAIQLIFNRSWSTQNPYWRRRVDFQHVYTYQPTYEAIRQAYFNTTVERVAPNDTRAPNGTDPIRQTIPAVFMEGHYEDAGHNIAPEPAAMRRQVGWALTSGAPGDFYGNNDWQFETGWASRLDRAGVTGAGNLRAAIEDVAWWKLVPSTSFVSSGAGTAFVSSDNAQKELLDDTYATAAVAPDGSVAAVYLPTQRAITINTGALGGSPSGRWVNAATGAESAATLGALTPPSSGDWLLILEAAPVGTTGSAAAVLPGLTQAVAGQRTIPSTTGAVASTLPAATQAASGTRTVPSVAGAASTVLPPAMQAAFGETVAPAIAGTTSSVLAAATQIAIASSAPPIVNGTASSLLPAATQTIDGAASGPGVGGSTLVVLSPVGQSASGTASSPIVTGTAAASTPPLRQSLIGTTLGSGEQPTFPDRLTLTVDVALYTLTASVTVLTLEASV